MSTFIITTQSNQYTMEFEDIIHGYHYCLGKYRYEDFTIESIWQEMKDLLESFVVSIN